MSIKNHCILYSVQNVLNNRFPWLLYFVAKIAGRFRSFQPRFQFWQLVSGRFSLFQVFSGCFGLFQVVLTFINYDFRGWTYPSQYLVYSTDLHIYFDALHKIKSKFQNSKNRFLWHHSLGTLLIFLLYPTSWLTLTSVSVCMPENVSAGHCNFGVLSYSKTLIA